MKKFTIVFALILSMYSIQTAKAQSVEEGKMLVDVYYGWPNLFSTVLKNAYAAGYGVIGLDIKSAGPFGGRFEYLLSDKIGVGADISYVTTVLKWQENVTSTYNYKLSVPKLTILGRMNFHFSDNDKLDAYGTVGVGYRNRKINWTTDDPFFIDSSTSSFLPVGFRAGVGLRYFLTDNFGLGAEFGLGGPLLTFGVTGKF